MSVFKRIFRSRFLKAVLQVIFSFALAFSLLMSLRMALGVENPLFVVSSGSMVPALNIGDLIVVQRSTPAEVRIGDIVVFRNPRDLSGTPIVHRVTDISVDEYGNYKISTIGDAVGGRADQFSPWDASLLIGKVIMRIPYIGNIYLFLASEKNLLPFIILVVLIIFLVLFFSGDEDERVTQKKELWNGARLAYIIVINMLIIYFLFFSLWGHIKIWQPGAPMYRQVNIIGMFKELQLSAERYGGENVFLVMGFITYRIDCVMNGSIRQGVPTFSWFQLLLLILALFNIVEVLVPIIRSHLSREP
ncbi:MAG: signal peptidase I [Candidatus Bathyarchaeia archaeon]